MINGCSSFCLLLSFFVLFVVQYQINHRHPVICRIMAKSNKLEDYWKQHHVENLFKDLTHLLVQNMPVDPAAAIVQYLQKKFAKSFKASSNSDDQSSDLLSRSMGNSLKSKMVTNSSSKHHDIVHVDDREHRQSLNQSQISGIAPIPSVGSAFTNLFKQKVKLLHQKFCKINWKFLFFLALTLGQQYSGGFIKFQFEEFVVGQSSWSAGSKIRKRSRFGP